MIVTIDGPAGAGKSTVARALAERLGYRFLDTGAMYRAVTLAAVRAGLAWDEPDKLAALAMRLHIELGDNRVFLDGEDVTTEIRTSAITGLTHYAANNPGVRSVLVALQQRWGRDGKIVTEGRDQGTVVFPQAECKLFLTASAQERAQRRMRDLEARGEHIPFERVLSEQQQRDDRDRQRDVGPLVAAHDAIPFPTDGLDPDEVVNRLEAIVRKRMHRLAPTGE